MQTSFKIGIGVIIAAAIGGTAWVLTKKQEPQPTSTSVAMTETEGTGDKVVDRLIAGPDVITSLTFDCTPRNEHERYRTDRTLVVDPTDPNIMYINVEWKGVYKTTDGGQTWAQKVKGIKVYANKDDTTKGCYSEYPVIKMDPNDHLHLVLGASGGGGGNLSLKEPNSQTGGAYQSFDGGETWKMMINSKMNFYLNDVAFDSKNPATIYYGTSSNPASWQGSDQNKIYVKDGLVYKTTNNGKTWTELPTGIGQNSAATFVMVNPKNPEELVVPTYSAKRLSADGTGTGVSTGKDFSVAQMGILHSLDGGNTWSKLTDIPGNPSLVYGAFASTDFTHMFFRVDGQTADTIAGYVTSDGGTTWKKTKYLDLVSYDPHDPTAMHMVGYTTVVVGPGSQALHMWESKDGGVTWSKLGTLPKEITDATNTPYRPTQIEWHPTDKNTFYMTGGGGHIWKTTDLARTWSTLLSVEKLPK
ncbi:MAG TPA: sialidase family protein [Patescibacteria group bacterium]